MVRQFGPETNGLNHIKQMSWPNGFTIGFEQRRHLGAIFIGIGPLRICPQYLDIKASGVCAGVA
jgi:hypothetical protein